MDSNFKRFTIISQKNPNTGAYDLAGAPKDIRSIVNSYLKSALEENEFFKVTERKIDKSGRVSVDVFVHSDKASLVEKAKKQAEEKFQFIDEGNQIGEKYHITKARPVTVEQLSLLQAEERRPQEIIVEKEQQKALKIKQAEEIRKQKQADREARAEEQRKKQEEKKELAESRAQARHTHSALLKVIGVATVGVGILRRILTSVLTFATKTQRDMIQSQNIGISYPLMRQYSLVEKAHGLQEGTFMGGLQAIQQAFGNITSLDDKKLSDLAVVMGSEVTEAVKMGLGQSNPDKLMQMIVDKFSERANAGYNSIGQYVGQPQAQRELYSYLQKIFPELATIFGTMQEEQHNISSLHRQEVATLSDFVSSVPKTGGQTTIDYNVKAVLGQEWNILNKRLSEIVDGLTNMIAQPLSDILHHINNWRFGMSEEENAEANRRNKEANQKQLDTVRPIIASMQKAKNLGQLTEDEGFYLEVLQEYRDKLEEAQLGTTEGFIDDVTKNPEALRQLAISRGRSRKAYFGMNENPEEEFAKLSPRVFKNFTFKGISSYEELEELYAKEQGEKAEKAFNKAKEKRDKQLAKERKQAFSATWIQTKKETRDEIAERVGLGKWTYISPELKDFATDIYSAEKMYGIDLTHSADGTELSPLKQGDVKAIIAKVQEKLGTQAIRNMHIIPYDKALSEETEKQVTEQMPTLDKPISYNVDNPGFYRWVATYYPEVIKRALAQRQDDVTAFQLTGNRYSTYIAFPDLQEQVKQKVAEMGTGGYTATVRGENVTANGQITYRLLVDITDAKGNVTTREINSAVGMTGFSGVVGESKVTVNQNGSADFQSMLSEGASSAKQAMQGGKK